MLKPRMSFIIFGVRIKSKKTQFMIQDIFISAFNAVGDSLRNIMKRNAEVVLFV